MQRKDSSEISNISERVRSQKQQGKVIVLASGVFDLLHEEHKNYLKKSKQVGDVLVVAIESDVRTRELKGEGRPVQNQGVRLQQVQSLPYVDFAFILPEDFSSREKYEELLNTLRPDIYTCSSNSPFQEKKRELVEKFGGKLLVVHEYNPSVSTTKLIAQSRKVLA